MSANCDATQNHKHTTQTRASRRLSNWPCRLLPKFASTSCMGNANHTLSETTFVGSNVFRAHRSVESSCRHDGPAYHAATGLCKRRRDDDRGAHLLAFAPRRLPPAPPRPPADLTSPTVTMAPTTPTEEDDGTSCIVCAALKEDAAYPMRPYRQLPSTSLCETDRAARRRQEACTPSSRDTMHARDNTLCPRRSARAVEQQKQ